MQADCCSTAALLLLLPYLVPGWLLRLACNERMKEEFDTLHEAVLEMLKVRRST
jgi:hypothetical protein